MRHSLRTLRTLAVGTLAAAGLAFGTSGCGGGGGGSGAGGTLKGLILVDFVQSSEDNVPLNRILRFIFSSPLDPTSVGPASIQIREGPTYGQAVFGRFIVQSANVYFEPQLPGRCDKTDGGFHASTDYRVTVIGSPEEFAVRSLVGDPLQATVVDAFRTRLDTDPPLYEDPVPNVGPSVTQVSPANGTAMVPVNSSNKVVINFSESLEPCTVTEDNIRFFQVVVGDPVNGFVPSFDTTPGDPFTWGSGTPEAPPKRVRCQLILNQDFQDTSVTLVPNFGEFPDNALLVVQVTTGLEDFGGLPATPFSFAFTTENRPPQAGSKTFEFDGDMPVLVAGTTADYNTSRSPSKAQGYLLFAGDGDNGATPGSSTFPAFGPCPTAAPVGQANDGALDDFDPTGDVILDTGATRSQCNNTTDGSKAVIYEFNSFRIRNGITVRITGNNPAIILVQGDIRVEAGGRLLVRGDANGGTATPNGGNGTGNQTWTAADKSLGGTAYAGGGTGGVGRNQGTSSPPAGGFYSEGGVNGYGSLNYAAPPVTNGTPAAMGEGYGAGAVATTLTASNNPTKSSPGGGGAGHVTDGGSGQNLGNNAGSRTLQNSTVTGTEGGLAYGDVDNNPTQVLMQTPEAGSGGGGGGHSSGLTFTTSQFVMSNGGGGGAGGGFVDLTSTKDIFILGTIDAIGGNGGAAAAAFLSGGGGGGGGSGGGIRLLTPGKLWADTTTLVTTRGGQAGAGASASGAPANNGGAGAPGRIAIETGDGQITKLNNQTSNLNNAFFPAIGNTGSTRFPFHGARFQGGGLYPMFLSGVFDAGPYAPDYTTPVAADFIAGIPAVASRGFGKAGIYMEAQGYTALADGTVNLASASGWKTVGYFTDTASETAPAWVPNAKPPIVDVPAALLPSGNSGIGIDLLDGRPFLQIRIMFLLPLGIGPFDPGCYVDRWTMRFTYDQ